ncbi:MarR family winged helix-turn-helix transcriptional regulator [Lacticaseibacillus sp. N501-2]|uniref:MarR family winged helix-turn-helix transcriptional regulator n=1 Tax=Lacticaseibacillus salsurae TaxID=3367729 RepID=UPI0038B27A8B
MELENEHSVVEALYRLNTLNQGHILAKLRELTLTIHQARSLLFIAKHPQTSQKHLADYLGKQDATVTNLVKVLEKRDLVSRFVVPGNERQKAVSLTAKGQALVVKIHGVFRDREAAIEQLLSAPEHTELLQLLQRLTRELNA